MAKRGQQEDRPVQAIATIGSRMKVDHGSRACEKMGRALGMVCLSYLHVETPIKLELTISNPVKFDGTGKGK